MYIVQVFRLLLNLLCLNFNTTRETKKFRLIMNKPQKGISCMHSNRCMSSSNTYIGNQVTITAKRGEQLLITTYRQPPEVSIIINTTILTVYTCTTEYNVIHTIALIDTYQI